MQPITVVMSGYLNEFCFSKNDALATKGTKSPILGDLTTTEVNFKLMTLN